MQSERALAQAIDKGRRDAKLVRDRTRDIVERARAQAVVDRAEWRLEQTQRWVFSARNPKATEGHYLDSKSILSTIKADAGLVEVGLTMHDFRRTLGRFAAKLLSGHMVSQLLRHHATRGNDSAMADVTQRYAEGEWPDLRASMARVEEAVIATSPTVWNMLRDPGDVARPRMDEREPGIPSLHSQPGVQVVAICLCRHKVGQHASGTLHSTSMYR